MFGIESYTPLNRVQTNGKMDSGAGKTVADLILGLRNLMTTDKNGV